ncbi:hypothetical protein HMPREF3212_04376 [Citrobacter freundii]|nr:hypothetical protein HMPREF3212_04376 [Citrobacter freundii]
MTMIIDANDISRNAKCRLAQRSLILIMNSMTEVAKIFRLPPDLKLLGQFLIRD